MKIKIHHFILIILFMAIIVFSIRTSPVNNQFTELEQITLPIKIHLIKEPSNTYSTTRDFENIFYTFEQANRIWLQGNIHFQIEEIVVTGVTSNTMPEVLNEDIGELFNHPNFDRKKINVFFSKDLNHINGQALLNINSALVADFTTVNDYRTLAHEIGHLLGLQHVPPANKLMASGKNGEILADYEILAARQNALKHLEFFK